MSLNGVFVVTLAVVGVVALVVVVVVVFVFVMILFVVVVFGRLMISQAVDAIPQLWSGTGHTCGRWLTDGCGWGQGGNFIKEAE